MEELLAVSEQDDPPMRQVPLLKHLQRTCLVFKNSLSIILCFLMETFVMTINLHVAGLWPDQRYVDGLGMAIVLIHCLGGILVEGMNAGYVTFAGRAYGNGNWALLQDYNCKQVLCLLISTTGTVALLALSYPLLLLLGQDEEVSWLAFQYGMGLAPSFVLLYVFDFLCCFLNAVDIYTPITVNLVISGLLHILLAGWLQDWVFWAPLVATFLTYLVSTAALLCYVLLMVPECRTLQVLPSRESLAGFLPYFKEVLLQALPMFFDVFYYELNAVVVGSFQKESMTAAHIILANLFASLYSVPFGVGGAVCSMSSNYIGENKPNRVRALYPYSCALSVAYYLLVFALVSVTTTKNLIISFFTQNEQTQLLIADILLLYRWFFLFDTLQATTNTFLRTFGFGREMTIAYLCVYYLLAAPASILLGRVAQLQLRGVWIAFGSAVVLIFVYISMKLGRVDWRELTQLRHDEVLKGAEF